MIKVFPWWQVTEDIGRNDGPVCICHILHDGDGRLCYRCHFDAKLGMAIVEGSIRSFDASGAPWSIRPSLVRCRSDSKDHCVSVSDVNKWLIGSDFSEYEWKPKCVAKAACASLGRPPDKRSLRELENTGDLAKNAGIAHKRVKKKKNNISITKAMVAKELKANEYKNDSFGMDSLTKKIRVKQFK